MEEVGLELVVVIQVEESFIEFNDILLVFPERETLEQGIHLVFCQFSKDYRGEEITYVP